MQTSYSFEAIGTHWKVDANEGIPTLEVKDFIDQFDRDYSRFRDDSLVTKISRKKGIYTLPKNAKLIFHFYEKLYKLTSGAITPLIGSVMVQAGYDAKYSLMAKKLTRPPKWEDIISYEYPKLVVRKPILLDFGAAGKGYLIDLVGSLLKKNGVKNFCIDAGGDILYSSKKGERLRVGLEHPDNTSQVIGVTEILNESICGSAGNRRRWGKFNHIINPHTLKPIADIKATWVIAKEAMIADGLATALFFVKPERLIKDFTFEYFIVYKDFSFSKSENFKGEIFKN
jgi:FAD:protein FMN transferase